METKIKIPVSFWGVRGSLESLNKRGSRYGGHTPCVAFHYGKKWFICDGGTGIRLLGKKLEKKREPIVLFLSHFHWDHIFGLPFFKPFYQADRKVLLAGPSNANHSFKSVLSQIMKPPYFPVQPKNWRAKMRWRTLRGGRFSIDSVLVEPRRVTHRGKTFAFRFAFPGGEKMIYVTDQELSPSDKKFSRWIQNADLLIHDSQFDLKGYSKKKGWGHSAFEVVLKMAVQSNVKKLVLFHHDPDASDKLLEKRLCFCRRYIRFHKSKLKCYLAKEGSTIVI